MAFDRSLHGPQIGHLHEEAFKLQAQRLGYTVFTTTAPYSRIDAILLKDNRLKRIQIKTAIEKDGIIYFRTATKIRNTKTGKRSKDLFYTNDDIDYFGLYCESLDEYWLVPVEYCRNKTTSRLIYQKTKVACVGCVYASEVKFM